MAYATSEQVTLRQSGITAYIGPDEILLVPEETNTVSLTRPELGYIMDLCCSLKDYDTQAEELSRKD